MAIPVECPECEFAFAIPDDFGGRKGKCPECLQVFRAPKSGDSSMLRSPAPPKAEGSGITPPDIQIDTRPAKSRTQASTQTPPSPALPDKETVPPSPREPVDAAPEPPATDEPQVPDASNKTPAGSNKDAAGLSQKSAEAADGRWFNDLDESFQDIPLSTYPGPEVASPAAAGAWRMWAVAAGGMLIGFLLFGLALLLIRPQLQSPAPGGSPNLPSPPPRKSPAVTSLPVEPPPPPLSAEQMSRIADRTLSSLARIEVESPSGNRAGSGFLVDPRGRVALPYSLLVDAARVTVTLHGSEPVDSLGLLSADESYDLAIIQIPQPKVVNLGIPIAIYEPLAKHDRLVIASGSGLRDELLQATCGELVSTEHSRGLESLSAGAKSRLRELSQSAPRDLTWVEFSQPVTPTMNGLPLLSPAGEAVGIAIEWGPDLEHGFAIHARHLAPLLEVLDDNPEAIAFLSGSFDASVSTAVTATPPITSSVPIPDPSIAAAVRPEVPDAAAMGPLPESPKVNATDIGRWLAYAKGLNFVATERDHVDRLQQLAQIINQALTQADDETIAADKRTAAVEMANEALLSISETRWPPTLEFADKNNLQYDRLRGASGGDGVFLRCRLHVDNPSPPEEFGKRNLLLFQVYGTENFIGVPVKEMNPLLKPNSEWLVIGQVLNLGRGLVFNEGDATHRVEIFVEAHSLVEKPKPLPGK
ncbi:hypothetical protein [Lignipirellula cremea]|uniref:Uncharacterized protein n=1 Tax=Lignipirellula cremea TaxID=2528010 RepID=A0A518E359_9BACT|nr:hypothetical protein [Lignipirellula cremea]QDU98530.1 hypothetical protein Pla8534_63990 [Lignipirellula cremea]